MFAATMRMGAGAEPRRRHRFWGLLLLALVAALALQAWPGTPAPAAVAQGQLLEDLNFRVEYLLWKEVARARLTLTSLGPGRYRVELSGEPMGLMKTLAGPRRDSYQTEMIWRDGKFVPLVYREESRKKNKRYLKEYRFDYEKGQLELWQLKEGRGVMVRKWHTTLKGPIQDPLSAFYNYRLGLLGPIKEGEILRLEGIPYPKPEEIEVRIGPETEWGRKVMISINNEVFANERGTVFAYLDSHRVPRKAWTNAFNMGTISGELLPGGKPLNGALPEMARTASPVAGRDD
ncbi:MAG: DUF3108 domain-containing protein [Desulfobaccales bacterium]